MLRITKTFEDDLTITLRLDGKIIATTVPDLEELCLRYRGSPNKSVSLDFSGVTFIDNDALKTLKKIKTKGVAMVNGSPFVETLLNGQSPTPKAAETPLAGLEEAADLDARSNGKLKERLLVDRLRAGDAEAFDAVFHQHVNQVYRQALRLLGNEADAEDVVQEVFLAVHNKAKTFRGQAEFSTWLYRLTVNTALSRLRRQKRSKEVLYDDYLPKFQKDGHHLVRPVVDWSNDIDERSANRELQQILTQALNQLKPVDKAVVVMSDLEGFSDREIANTLGLSVAAVKTRLHRARLFLRGKLAVHLGYSPT